jgi:hypothetical protein
MEFKKSVIDLIKIRKSIRSYESVDLKQEDKKNIIDFIKKDHKTVFGCKLRFEFIDASDLDPADLKNLGTYGMITGAKYFIAGTDKCDSKKDHCLVDFGYAFEKIILFITDLGLGTCWLGGTFNKKGFSEKIILKQDEVIPAVSPFGVISKKRHLKSSIIRTLAGSKNRKQWDKLFFNNSFLNPLDESDAGSYKVPLEMVRLAPSASNKQPWRIIRENNIFHFFIKRSRIPGYLNIQYIDIGISLCHFELAAIELDLKGKWEVKEGIQQNKQYDIPSNTDYIISWNGV